MQSISIALLQMLPFGTDQDANLKKGDDFCRRARAMGADIALFPEMWNTGYAGFDTQKPSAHAEWAARAIDQDSSYVRHFQALALELEMAIALTYLEKWSSAPRNSVSLIDRHGRICFTYAKVHTCDWDWEGYLTSGDDFVVCDLDTASGTLKVGTMICFDREHPEAARILMLKGAEIILTPNACGLEPNRIGQFRARAYENMLGLAMTNYPAPQENGHSVAFDAACFNGDGTQDPLIIEAGESEGIYLASFDIERIRRWREREVWGNAFRKPKCYHQLTSLEVAEPFKREKDKKR